MDNVILRNILNDHKAWANGEDDGVRANLAHLDLRELYMQGRDLRWVNFTGANMAGVDLSFANMSEACLTGADLRGANLTGVNFANAMLVRADLTDAVITHASFMDADLSYAQLKGVLTVNAIMSRATVTGTRLAEVTDEAGKVYPTPPEKPAAEEPATDEPDESDVEVLVGDKLAGFVGWRQVGEYWLAEDLEGQNNAYNSKEKAEKWVRDRYRNALARGEPAEPEGAELMLLDFEQDIWKVSVGTNPVGSIKRSVQPLPDATVSYKVTNKPASSFYYRTEEYFVPMGTHVDIEKAKKHARDCWAGLSNQLKQPVVIAVVRWCAVNGLDECVGYVEKLAPTNYAILNTDGKIRAHESSLHAATLKARQIYEKDCEG